METRTHARTPTLSTDSMKDQNGTWQSNMECFDHLSSTATLLSRLFVRVLLKQAKNNRGLFIIWDADDLLQRDRFHLERCISVQLNDITSQKLCKVTEIMLHHPLNGLFMNSGGCLELLTVCLCLKQDVTFKQVASKCQIIYEPFICLTEMLM